MTRTLGRVLALAFAATLAARASRAAACAPSATALCLSAQRFAVEVHWKDFQGNTGQGQAVALTADTGYFWFFSASNVELIVKVLDARAINQKFWVFFGALSNVEYTLTVTDSVTGAVKTYQNPSGQFASVGDTSAFDGSGSVVVASDETVIAKGTAAPPSSIADIQRFIDRAAPPAAAFTPCPGPATSLYLSNCRFRVDVQWTTSKGDAGPGQAVQLTNDTGYFWFFNDTNVELMVKVLDARPVNDKYWVFFGALSNVEYTLEVTDKLSGARHTYHNDLNTFASVGDTAAFRGGYGITVESDPLLEVSETISAKAGGSISAAAADGTLFTLEVPPNAFFVDQTISMTPVRSAASFPFAGGLAAGVLLQPAGLLLLNGATLSVHTPTAIPRAEETPVAWNGSGEDFFLFPPDPAGGDLRMQIFHLGGYGVARATDAEREAQLRRDPLADADLLSHRMSPFLRSGRAAAAPASRVSLEATTDWKSDFKTAMDIWYGVLRSRMLEHDGDPQTFLDLMGQVSEWKSLVERDLGSLDTVFPGRRDEIKSLWSQMARKALAEIHKRCSQDARHIQYLQRIAFLAEFFGLDVQIQVAETLGCLTFKLRFESTLQVTKHYPSPVGDLSARETVLAEVTLRTTKTDIGEYLTKGDGTIDYTEVSATLSSHCTYTKTSAPGTFSAKIEWGNLETPGKPPDFTLPYNAQPGFSDIAFTCPDPDGGPPATGNLPYVWTGLYNNFHPGTQPPWQFKQWEWTFDDRASSWAHAHVTLPGIQDITEDTKFTITHTPQ